MERAIAIKKLRKLLGSKFGYQVNPKAPTKEEREAAGVALKHANEKLSDAQKRREARYKAILEADAEYQNLNADCVKARQEHDDLSSLSYCYKFTVGTTSSLFFHVAAQGDSWEEVIEKLQKS